MLGSGRDIRLLFCHSMNTGGDDQRSWVTQTLIAVVEKIEVFTVTGGGDAKNLACATWWNFHCLFFKIIKIHVYARHVLQENISGVLTINPAISDLVTMQWCSHSKSSYCRTTVNSPVVSASFKQWSYCVGISHTDQKLLFTNGIHNFVYSTFQIC